MGRHSEHWIWRNGKYIKQQRCSFDRGMGCSEEWEVCYVNKNGVITYLCISCAQKFRINLKPGPKRCRHRVDDYLYLYDINHESDSRFLEDPDSGYTFIPEHILQTNMIPFCFNYGACRILNEKLNDPEARKKLIPCGCKWNGRFWILDDTFKDDPDFKPHFCDNVSLITKESNEKAIKAAEDFFAATLKGLKENV